MNPALVASNPRIAETAALAERGFAYPPLLIELLHGELPSIGSRIWICDAVGRLEFCARVLRDVYPDRLLIPFAYGGGRDDIYDVYCFDATDRSGDPAVHVIRAFTEPGSEYRGHWPDFASWLVDALRW